MLTSEDRQSLAANGWVEIPFGVDEDMLALAAHFGKPVASRRGSGLVDRLVPTKTEEAQSRSLSAIYGLGAFPFHTDSAYYRIPPRYMIMRLVSGSEVQRPTLLIDWFAFPLSEAERNVLCRDVWLVNGGHGRFLASIIDDMLVPGNRILRFDRECMRPAYEAFGESAKVIDEHCTMSAAVSVHWVCGKVLIIDNWRVLHARGEAETIPNENRILERVLVATHEVGAS